MVASSPSRTNLPSLPQRGQKKICIVTTRHISYNPRVLKEADTLHNGGFSVTVVTVNNHMQQRKHDEALMQERGWQLQTVNFRREVSAEKRQWLLFSVKQKLFAYLSRLTYSFGFAERAANKAFDALYKLAVCNKADLYIVHHPEALGIGYKAAKQNGARLAFDAEDFHSGMGENGANLREDAMAKYLEKKYLPCCDYVTAASKGIAEAYVAQYGIVKPDVVLNVFPKVPIPERRTNTRVKFYWYSQVIGPNRNLEYLLSAAAAITHDFEIHLRGSLHSDEYKLSLESIVKGLELSGKVFFHEPIFAEEIIPDGSRYDVGLALESNVSVNRNICVTNKTFAYLMAGLAIIGTDTDGQKDIFKSFPEAALLCSIDDPSSLAAAMTHFIMNPDRLLEAKTAARSIALERFNWETESQKIFESVSSVLS